MSAVVKLHGGPMHGHEMTVEDHVREIEVVQPVIVPSSFMKTDDLSYLNAEVPVIYSLYTRVFNRRTPTSDFEWVGRIKK